MTSTPTWLAMGGCQTHTWTRVQKQLLCAAHSPRFREECSPPDGGSSWCYPRGMKVDVRGKGTRTACLWELQLGIPTRTWISCSILNCSTVHFSDVAQWHVSLSPCCRSADCQCIDSANASQSSLRLEPRLPAHGPAWPAQVALAGGHALANRFGPRARFVLTSAVMTSPAGSLCLHDLRSVCVAHLSRDTVPGVARAARPLPPQSAREGP